MNNTLLEQFNANIFCFDYSPPYSNVDS